LSYEAPNELNNKSAHYRDQINLFLRYYYKVDQYILDKIEPSIIFFVLLIFITKKYLSNNLTNRNLYSMLKKILAIKITIINYSLFLILGWLWIFLVRWLPNSLDITKLFYLIQGWGPGEKLFQDSTVFQEAINCPAHVDIFESNDCLTFRWNYPNYISSLPSWQFWWLVYLALFLLSYIYLVTQSFKLLEKSKSNTLSAVLLTCPPMLYAIERGSLDIQVAAALIFLYNLDRKEKFSKVQLSKLHRKTESVKVVLIASGVFTYLTIIKFYPIVFFVTALFAFKKKQRLIVLTVFIFNIALSLFWLDAPKFILINDPYNHDLPVGVLNYLRFITSNPIVLIPLIGIYLFLLGRNYKFTLNPTSTERFFTYLPLMLFLSFWLVAGSASYRAIFLVVFLLLYWHEKTIELVSENQLLNSNRSQDLQVTVLTIAILFTTGLPIINNTLILLLLLKMSKPIMSLLGIRQLLKSRF